MVDEGFKRKLTAILSADAVGYSRLMREDEEATVRDIAAHRVLITEIIKQHHGRVVDSPGDNLLAEFASVVDAVNGAIKIQAEIKRSNADTPKDRRMEFRIGINLGDVIEEEKRIYGDGVNIAARVEGLASVRGIAISGTVYEHIKDKLSLGYHYLGEQDVKNIPEPVRIYRLLTEHEDAGKMIGDEKHKTIKLRWAALGALSLIIIVSGSLTIWNYYFRGQIEPAAVEKMAFPLPEKPSIAVLPFDNMSGDPAQDYIVDGMTEAIITGLSRTPEMFVIARNSTFTYKGQPVKVKQVSEELGVRYVLEGSVQKTGNRLRINAQLIDAINGHHLWADKYDRDLKDLFALQDEITMKVITELQVKMTKGEYARVLVKGTKNIEAYLKYLNGVQVLFRLTKEDIIKSRKMFKEIIALDPNYPSPHLMLGWNYFVDAVWLGSKSPNEDLAHAEDGARKALALDDSLGLPHGLLAEIYAVKKQWDKALAEAQLAVSKDPNTLTMRCQAETLKRVGRHGESVAWWEKVLRLNPYPPTFFLSESGHAYFLAGRYEDALAQHKRVLERAKKGEWNLVLAHENLAYAYAMLGQDEKARYHVAELLKIDPKYSCKWVALYWGKVFKNQADVDHFVNALRKAGLPD